MQKKKKAAVKAVAKKVSPKSKATPKVANNDYSLRVTSAIVAMWGLILAGLAVFFAIGLTDSASIVNEQTKLVNLFLTIILGLLALVTFKVVLSLSEMEDDGYLSSIVLLLNAGILGYTGFTSFVEVNGSFFWPILIVAALGLMFLLPLGASFKKSTEHNLTTWTIILHILLWFGVVIMGSLAANVV